MGKDSKFTRDDDNNVAVRVVSATASSTETDKESMFCRDEEGFVAVRVVAGTEEAGTTNSESMFCKDTNGNVSIRVVGAGGGDEPVIEELDVTPTTSEQIIVAPEGIDGYSPVNVGGVTSDIDSNIVAGNIKSGVSILGVSGSVTELNGATTTINPSTSSQTVTPTSPNNGFTSVTVPAVTSSIDANIAAGNIKKDVTILGVTGSYEGSVPSGTKTITTNGTHDVAGYASADVQVPTTAPTYYIEKSVDANGRLVNLTSNFINLSGVTELSTTALHQAYMEDTMLTGTIDMSSIKTVSGKNACSAMLYNCRNITKLDLSGLETISGESAFSQTCQNDSSLVEVDMSNLKSALATGSLYETFRSCTALQTLTFPALETLNSGSVYSPQYVFPGLVKGCTNLISLSFPKLSFIRGTLGQSYSRVTEDCSKLESLSFGGLKADTFSTYKDQFQHLFSNTTGSAAPNGCTLHLPENFDPDNPDKTFDITTLTGYPTFGGSASYIHLAYDLPATE